MPKFNAYKTLFNHLILVEKQTFQTACKETFLQYMKDLPRGATRSKTTKSPIRIEIGNLIKHIEKAEIGAVLVNYELKSPVSAELSEFVQIAKLKETQLFNMRSELVVDCENKAAAQGNSPQSIYEQLGRLEMALQTKTVASHHLNEVNDKVHECYVLLYEKFAFLIVEAKDVEMLKQKIAQSFIQNLFINSDSCLAIFRHEIYSQIEYLEDKKFFEKFYLLSDLAEKYEFAYEFFRSLQESVTFTSELRTTLMQLLYLIINKAYAPCDAKKFNLMRDENAPIEAVFTDLKKWAVMRWKKYDNGQLVVKLCEKLLEQEQHYKAWREIVIREELAQVPKLRSMFELHCWKYSTSDPAQDPVKALQIQKPKDASSVDDIQSAETSDNPNMISLKPKEELDFPDEEKENQEKKRLKSN